MKIVYKEDYNSISKFNSVECSDFAVITGVNGSGKTHLLQAILRNKVVIEGLENQPVVYFNYTDFYLDNESIFNAQQIVTERNEAWAFFLQRVKEQIKNWKNELLSREGLYERLLIICREKERYLFDVDRTDLEDDEQRRLLVEYKVRIRRLFTQNNDYKNNPHAKSIYAIITRIAYSIDEITEYEFSQLYRPFVFKNDFLPSQLGRIFWDYYIKFKENKIKRYENENEGQSHFVLSDVEFIRKHGNKPWEVANYILESFNTLEYKINSPEELSIFDNYLLKLHHVRKGIAIDFSSLSSGEKVLMALVATMYKMGSDGHFPSILLLDEIDASLHPSMIQNLLDVLLNVFASNGTHVILVTHSPTTVALAPDASVYVMMSDGEDRIISKPKSEALGILTEGFATLDKGIKLFDQISRKNLALITEGKNTEYINKALELLSPALIPQVEIITGAEGNTGKDQLKTLFDFFCKVTHDKKVLFVWDCDYNSNSLSSTNNTTPYSLTLNSANDRVKSGIENLFDKTHFTSDFYVKSIGKDGGDKYNLDKTKFKEFILGRNISDDFSNFTILIEKIKTLI